MKKAVIEIRNLITFAAIVMFLFFAFNGLTFLEDKCELSRKTECSECCCKHCGSDGNAACVIPSDEIEKNEKNVDVGTSKDSNPSEVAASEHQRVLRNNESHMGENDLSNLLPVNDDIEEKTCGRNERHDECNRVLVESHRSILLCLVCLFVILLPCVFENIIQSRAAQGGKKHD